MEQGEICLSLKMKVSAKCGLLPAGMSCCGRAGIKVGEGAPFPGGSLGRKWELTWEQFSFFFCRWDLGFKRCHNMCLRVIMRWHNLVARLDTEAPASLRVGSDLTSVFYSLCK